ncbi:hypothetical protein [Methylobacterium sp. J-090]|nr:hypothetical protein [Methylobacterium sp. J-090]
MRAPVASNIVFETAAMHPGRLVPAKTRFFVDEIAAAINAE